METITVWRDDRVWRRNMNFRTAVALVQADHRCCKRTINASGDASGDASGVKIERACFPHNEPRLISANGAAGTKRHYRFQVPSLVDSADEWLSLAVKCGRIGAVERT